MSSISNCLGFSFPPFPEELRGSFSGKLLAVEPGVNEGGIVDDESMVWVIGMSRGVGDGFVDGTEYDGVGESKEDEERLLGDGERAVEALAGELAKWVLGPTGVVLRSGMSTDVAALRTASYSWAVVCGGVGRSVVLEGLESAMSSNGPSCGGSWSFSLVDFLDFLDCDWPIERAFGGCEDEAGSVWADCGRDLESFEDRTEMREGASFGDVTNDCRSPRRCKSG